ncbi:hypothetical protein BJ508DRAFT_361595 [Ascobolus immersus RN42]|uniref:Uncharacterized protein n=1 Tax=Ascobolus immersus RN42 TaxID=1160509 RepID=A0A3N4I946_ASCIM|nr:hypothetical protein BJ508DRAFT_361595 [Ascobolus immersus RN42]
MTSSSLSNALSMAEAGRLLKTYSCCGSLAGAGPAGYGYFQTPHLSSLSLKMSRLGITSMGFICVAEKYGWYDRIDLTTPLIFRYLTVDASRYQTHGLRFPLVPSSTKEQRRAFLRALYPKIFKMGMAELESVTLDHGRSECMGMVEHFVLDGYRHFREVVKDYVYFLFHDLEPHLNRFECEMEGKDMHSSIFWYPFNILQTISLEPETVHGVEEAIRGSIERLRGMISSDDVVQEFYYELAKTFALVEALCAAHIPDILLPYLDNAAIREHEDSPSPDDTTVALQVEDYDELWFQSRSLALGRYGTQDNLDKLQSEADDKGRGEIWSGTPVAHTAVDNYFVIFEKDFGRCEECERRRDLLYHWQVE